jgi:hypothetical protein
VSGRNVNCCGQRSFLHGVAFLSSGPIFWKTKRCCSDPLSLRAIGSVSIPTASQNAPRLVGVVGLQCFHQDELLARLLPMNCKMPGILSVRDHVGVHLEHLPGRHVSEIFQHPTSINNVYGIASQGGKRLDQPQFFQTETRKSTHETSSTFGRPSLDHHRRRRRRRRKRQTERGGRGIAKSVATAATKSAQQRRSRHHRDCGKPAAECRQVANIAPGPTLAEGTK